MSFTSIVLFVDLIHVALVNSDKAYTSLFYKISVIRYNAYELVYLFFVMFVPAIKNETIIILFFFCVFFLAEDSYVTSNNKSHSFAYNHHYLSKYIFQWVFFFFFGDFEYSK